MGSLSRTTIIILICVHMHAKFWDATRTRRFAASQATDPSLRPRRCNRRGHHSGSCTGEQNGDDSPLAFALHLTDALAGSVAGRVLAALEDRIPDALVPAVRHLLFAAERPLGPQQVARASFRHEKTLREQLRAAGLPSTQKLIVWARLFHAAQLLGGGRRSVENVAGTLDVPSASALANQLGRYAGVKPGQLHNSVPEAA
jgi:AraC-like DNA-binding protein